MDAVHEQAERLLERELERFEREHPRSGELSRRASASLLAGVPMHWMVRWPGAYPGLRGRGLRARASATSTGIEYVDFCLGDTGAMTGHSPEPVVRAVAEQAARGITLMLPSEEALWVGEELTRRFGLARWQFALTATDANRFAIRLARHVTGRPKILVFNWCYHGTVDESFATLRDGRVVEREANIGPPVPLDETTRVVEWNDVEALRRELAHGDVACVLAEPALTNIGIVHPQPGFHDALREADAGDRDAPDHRRDAHALRGPRRLHPRARARAGPAHRRQGDRQRHPLGGLRLLGGGRGPRRGGDRPRRVRCRRRRRHARGERALAGRRARHARARAHRGRLRPHDRARRAVRAGRAGRHRRERRCRGTSRASAAGSSTCSGASGPVTGSDAAAGGDHLLDRLIHLYALNRGILLTPFHNMALMSPATTEEDVDLHTAVFGEIAGELTDR